MVLVYLDLILNSIKPKMYQPILTIDSKRSKKYVLTIKDQGHLVIFDHFKGEARLM